MNMRNSPSCTCCGVVCLLAHAGQATNIFSGTWTDNGESDETTIHYTSDSNAYKYASAGASGNWRTAVQIGVAVTVVGAEHFTIRLLGGILNATNYTFIEFEFENTGLVSGSTYNRQWQCRLGYVAAGVTTYLANQPYTMAIETGSAWINEGDLGGHVISLTLCWDGTTLTGTVDTVATHGGGGTGPYDNTIIASNNVTPPGTLAGFGTGGLTDIDEVAFDDFVYERSYSAEDAPDCEECPVHCCQGPTPPTLTIEIAGTIANGTWFGCTYTCQDLVGTWVLDAAGASYLGDDGCSWELDIDIGVSCNDDIGKITATIGTDHRFSVLVEARFSGASMIQISRWVTPVGEEEIPCEDWAETEIDAATGSWVCSPSSLTLTVSA